MTRASERQGAYRGRLGTTRKERVHYACADGEVVSVEVYRGVDARRDPELASRMLEADAERALNTVRRPGAEPASVEVPVVYHDPARELFALVLPPSARTRELHERAALMAALAEETDAAVPEYVRDFAVVYGPDGLRRYLEEREGARGTEERLVRREAELAARERTLVEREAALARAKQEVERRRAELVRPAPAGVPGAAPQPSGKSARAARDTEDEITTSVQVSALEPAQPERGGADADEQTNRVPRMSPEEIDTGEVMEVEPEALEENEPLAGDPVAAETTTVASSAMRVDGSTQVGRREHAIERWMVSREPTLKLLDEQGAVRLVASCAAKELEDLLSERLQVRLQLHRLPTYPLVTLAIGSRAAMEREAGPLEPLLYRFDVAHDDDRAILKALGERFRFTLELFDAQYLQVRRREVSAELEDNVGYVLSAAGEHLETVPAARRNYNRAVLAHADPDYDRFGRQHPERKQFREDKLSALSSPMHVRRALAIARRFSAAAGEEYLILTRGYSLALWLRQRRKILERALEVGLWVGPTLASRAVSEGLVPSRKELVTRLQERFARLVERGECDLDQDAVRDNWKSLQDEARALGLGERTPPRSTPIDSGAEAVASGVIGPAGTVGAAPAGAGLEARTRNDLRPFGQRAALINQLEDKDRRLEAALELCSRGEQEALPALFVVLERMTRGEAGRVLGSVVQIGEPAVSHLVEALGSRKGFLRQGAALALGVIKAERGVEAICDLLVSEPTEIWKEIARAIGEVGAGAVMSLVSGLAEAPEDRRERVAWALAHVANRGGRRPLETLAGGRDPVAAGVARHALELADLARSDDASVRGKQAPRDQTVNRAFSRRFFEALRSEDRAPVALTSEADVSGPAMVLDESDLIETNDLEEGPG